MPEGIAGLSLEQQKMFNDAVADRVRQELAKSTQQPQAGFAATETVTVHGTTGQQMGMPPPVATPMMAANQQPNQQQPQGYMPLLEAIKYIDPKVVDGAILSQLRSNGQWELAEMLEKRDRNAKLPDGIMAKAGRFGESRITYYGAFKLAIVAGVVFIVWEAAAAHWDLPRYGVFDTGDTAPRSRR